MAQRVKIDRLELAALGAAAMMPMSLFGEIANAVAKGMPLSPSEAEVVRLFIQYGVAHWGTGGALELSPVLSKALANLADGPADLAGAFSEFKPALELGMIKIPAAKLPPNVRP